MALTLAQLLAAPSVDNWRATLLAALQGIGIVVRGGPDAGGVGVGTGSLAVSGTPASPYPRVIVNITTSGELGAAAFQYSLDGGSSYVSGITVPATTGLYSLGATGTNITFAPGPAGTGVSFASGDSFTFALATPSLPVTQWAATGAYRQLVEVTAQSLAALSTQQTGLGAGGFTGTASGAWADLIGNGFYNLPRLGVGALASVTRGLVLISDASGAGPFNITTGTMWFASTNGLRYSNTTGGTLPKNGTLVLTVAAETTGASYNVANATITTTVAGNLPGVTVNNPDPGSGSWITISGTDPESDSAYMLRCTQRWPSLGAGSPAAQYQLWTSLAEIAAGHSATISRSLVQQDSAIAGQIDIYLATASGAPSGGAVTDVTSYITPRVALPATISAVGASTAVMTVAGVVNYYAARTTLSAVQTAVANALSAYINGLPISDGTTKVFYTEVDAAIGAVLGGAGVAVRNISSLTLNAGTTDVTLTLATVATLTNNLTFSAV